MTTFCCAIRPLIAQRRITSHFCIPKASSGASAETPGKDRELSYGKSHPDKQDLPPRAEAVLNYWFQDVFQSDAYCAYDPTIFKKWFQGGPEVDQEIRESFGNDVEKMGRGDYDSWQDNTYSALAAVIIMDQFSRVVHRGTSGMFALDSKCFELARHMTDSGKVKQLKAVEQMAIFLPFMHQENAQAQKDCVHLYKDLLADLEEHCSGDTSKALREAVAGSVKYSEVHKEVVDKFGRFPHRNALLERLNTPEEDEGFSKGTIPSF